MTLRLTKNEACQHLGKSLATIDRMINRGELQTELEEQGRRHRVYILLDQPEQPEAINQDVAAKASADIPTAVSVDEEVITLREKVKGLEELATYHRSQLTEKDRQLQEVLATLATAQRTAEQLCKALPAPPDGQTATKRKWWSFS